MNETLKIAIISAVVIAAVAALISFPTKDRNSEKVSYAPIPSIDASEEYIEYSKDFKTYTSKLGYSFEYPSHLFIVEDPEPFIAERILILASTINKDDIFGVVISVSENNEAEDPEQWVKWSYSGADLSKGYNIIDIDGQKAVSLEGGAWVVVNTPDNKYRLNIALLPGKNKELLFTEIGIVVSSFKFVK